MVPATFRSDATDGEPIENRPDSMRQIH